MSLFLARRGIGNVGYQPEYQRVLNYALSKGYAVPPTLAGKNADNLLIKEAKAIGLWNNCARFYNHHTTGDRNYACIDYRNPSDATTATLFNNVTYVTKSGFSGNGTNLYINYNFFSSTPLFLPDNCGVITYIGTTNAASARYFLTSPAAGNPGIQMRVNPSLNQIQCFIYGAAINFAINPPVAGMHILRRVSGVAYVSVNGSAEQSAAAVVTYGLTRPLIALANLDDAGTVSGYDFRRIDCLVLCKGSVVDPVIINTMWNNHRTRTALL
jgi:hypothetical protein